MEKFSAHMRKMTVQIMTISVKTGAFLHVPVYLDDVMLRHRGCITFTLYGE